MSEPQRMRLEDLRAAVERVLSAVESVHGPEVDFSADFYWTLPVESAFDMSRAPDDHTVGSLSDDLETLADEDLADANLAWHNLSHLVGLLRATEAKLRP